jgi:hypothetical protein
MKVKSDIKRVIAKDKAVRRGKQTEEYRCKCANRLFRVLVEPIRRKERTRESPDLRVGIECPLCGAEARIKLGGPN